MEIDNETVDLSLEISENNMKAYGVLAGMGISGKNGDSPGISGYPAFLYIDNNIFGTGNNFTGVFAGVFLSLNFMIPERGILPFSLSFNADGLFLPSGYNFIEKGKETEWNVKTPIYNASVKLEKETTFGLVLSTKHNLQINNYTGGTTGFTTPENNITYKGDLKLEFSTIESGFPSTFTLPVGFSFSVTPAIVFKPGYKAWGLDTDLFLHNDLPGGKFETTVKYYDSPRKRIFIGGSLTHYGGVNLYESERWSIGQIDALSSGPRLSGYLTGEYRSKSAVVANLDAHFQILQDKILIFAKHDMYYDIDENIFRQGSALGFALNLPFEIELNAEAGIGWNANRDESLGWSVQIALSRYFIR